MFFQALFLFNLTFGQGVFAPGIGVGTPFEFNPHRGAVQFQHPAIGVDQIALVGIGHGIGLVAVDDDQRRVLAALVGITQFNTPPPD